MNAPFEDLTPITIMDVTFQLVFAKLDTKAGYLHIADMRLELAVDLMERIQPPPPLPRSSWIHPRWEN